MGLFRRKTAVAEPPLPASTEALLEEIRRLGAANRERPEPATARRLLRLRHLAGVRLLDAAAGAPAYPAPDAAGLPADRLPDVAPAELTPGLLRAAILRDGCLLVRGLVDREDALALAAGIDRAFAARERGARAAAGYYEEFVPDAGFEVAPVRPWIKEGGGILAADSPLLIGRMLDLFERAGLPPLVEGYLGEPPLLSVHKTTLRKAEPSVGGSWHQDGAFMGGARALNLWLSLSRCGDEAPGLDLVPRRLEEIVVEHGSMLDVELTRAKAREAAGDVAIVRPIFEPGDALLFDEMFLHQTASDPSMTKPRFAIESWFFGGSAFPADYAPLAV
jgi:Phytanoyl-CoA dioxygenase (PhyH)